MREKEVLSVKNKVKFFGFLLIAASTVLAIVSIFLYNMALFRVNATTILLVVAAVAGVATLLLANSLGREISNFCVVVHTVLLMAALAVSIAPMVNEMGLVYAGLDPVSNLTGYFIFAAFVAVAWLLALVVSFTGIAKKQK